MTARSSDRLRKVWRILIVPCRRDHQVISSFVKEGFILRRILTNPWKILAIIVLMLTTLSLARIDNISGAIHNYIGRERFLGAHIIPVKWDEVAGEVNGKKVGSDPLFTREVFSNLRKINGIDSERDLNISLTWSDQSDLDLIVKQPDGQLVSFEPCRSTSCGTLDVDANRCQSRQSCGLLKSNPLENISWHGVVPRGRYHVFVGLYSTNGVKHGPHGLGFNVEIKGRELYILKSDSFSTSELSCKVGCQNSPRHVIEFTVD